MLLLGFFLLPTVFVTARELTINNYLVKINDNILASVEPIGESSVELDLSGLALENIDELAFRNAANLTILNMANNSLTFLPSERLTSLVNLKNLSLANNNIRQMPWAFDGIDHLETVDLSHNPLSAIHGFGLYGRGRCDFIVKGTPIMDVVYNESLYVHRPQTPKPLVPVFMGSNRKCSPDHGPSPDYQIQDDTNENIPLADEKIKCPKFNDPRQLPFGTSHTLTTTPLIEGCIEAGTLQRLSILPARSAASKNCKKILNPRGKPTLTLVKMDIEHFTRSWYRAKTVPFYSIDLSANRITSFTSDLLNDLPESVKHVSLSGNKIDRLDAGIIQNDFLISLDLSDNGLHEIQSNALNKTNLSGLILSRNNFTDTTFVENLPSSLTELYLNGNIISQVSDNSFSKLNNLFYLDLSSNKITQLGRQSLQGLSSLQWLILPGNDLRNIEAGAFRNLGELRELNLENNNMTEFKESVFSDLRELIFLNISGNNLKRVTKDTFKGLPDNLRMLEVSNNGIESLEKSSFSRVPKYRLKLNNNAISRIERGDINIPSLRELCLNKNKLSEIKKENFDLPKLEYLRLDNNIVGNIEKGAFRNLSNLYLLWISENPIKTLQKGSLFGINLGCIVYTYDCNLELIQGGAFMDE